MRSILYTLSFVCIICSTATFAAQPQFTDCSGPEKWAAALVGVRLKNLNLIQQIGGYDKIEVKLLASEQLPSQGHDRDIFRQVHKITIHDNGNIFTAITVNDASRQECSESGGDVYFIAIECGADHRCQISAVEWSKAIEQVP